MLFSIPRDRSIPWLLGLLLPMLLLARCAVRSGSVVGSVVVDDGVGAETGLTFRSNSDPASAELVAVADSDTSLNVLFTAAKDASGNMQALTGVEGTTDEGDAFDVTFVNGSPTRMAYSGGTIDIELVVEDEIEVTFDFASASAEAQARPPSPTRYLLAGMYGWADVEAGLSQCAAGRCGSGTQGLLVVLQTCVLFHQLFDGAFDDYCINSDDYGDQACRLLLYFADLFGRTADTIIAVNPDLPPDVRGLRFSSDPASTDNANDNSPPTPDNGNDNDAECPTIRFASGLYMPGPIRIVTQFYDVTLDNFESSDRVPACEAPSVTVYDTAGNFLDWFEIPLSLLDVAPEETPLTFISYDEEGTVFARVEYLTLDIVYLRP